MPAHARFAAFAGMAAASIGANITEGIDAATAAAFTIANAAEAAIALWLVRRREPGEMSCMAPRAVGNFCLAALVASAAAGFAVSKWLGLAAVVLASINIFGGFAVTQRMLAMYKKKERPAAPAKQ